VPADRSCAASTACTHPSRAPQPARLHHPGGHHRPAPCDPHSPGNAERTRTPTAYSANTSPKEPTYLDTTPANAAAESFNASMKRETLQGAQRWPGARAARLAVFPMGDPLQHQKKTFQPRPDQPNHLRTTINYTHQRRMTAGVHDPGAMPLGFVADRVVFGRDDQSGWEAGQVGGGQRSRVQVCRSRDGAVAGRRVRCCRLSSHHRERIRSAAAHPRLSPDGRSGPAAG